MQTTIEQLPIAHELFQFVERTRDKDGQVVQQTTHGPVQSDFACRLAAGMVTLPKIKLRLQEFEA
jgi:hypothetical protein